MASFAKGTAAIFAAKIFFLGAGYALYLSLSRLLTPEQFGVYGVLFAVVSLINMVLINGTLQTVSHFVASNPDGQGAVRRRAFLYQAVFALPALGLWLLVAPLVAGFFHDPDFVPLLRGATLITFVYAFYAINVGYLNGTRAFARQAALDVSFATLKVSAIVFLVYIGWGIPGVIACFAGAAITILAISFFVVGRTGRGRPVELPVRDFSSFAVKVLTVALFLNFVLNADIFLLKRLAPEESSNLLAGYYTAAQSIARIPYFLLVTASLVMFPTIAKLRGDAPAVRKERADVSSRAITMVMGLVAGTCAVAMPIAPRIVNFLYPEEYAPAADALTWLLPGMGVLAIMSLAISMISGAGRPGISTLYLAVTLVVQALVATALIPSYGIVGAAVGTTVATTTVFLTVLPWLRSAFGTRIRFRFWATAVVATATGAAASIGMNATLPDGRAWTLLILTIAFALDALVLFFGGVLTGVGTRPRAGQPRIAFGGVRR